jgi:hypothetical protein
MNIPSLPCRVLLFGAVLFSLAQIQSQELPKPQQSESELIDGYRRAHDRRDLEGMLKLFCWDKVTPEVRKVTEEHVKGSFDDNILTVRITTEHPKGRVNQFLRNGVLYGFNLTVIKELVLESAVPNGGPEMSYHPIGIKDDHYVIALMVPLPNGSATMQHSGDAPEKAPSPGATMGKLTVPAKTPLTVRLDQVVGLKLVDGGGGFSATLSRPVQANGVTVLPAGATVEGLVRKEEKYSPEMTLKSINLNGKSWRIQASTIVFNQQISYPAGTELTFELQFPLNVVSR